MGVPLLFAVLGTVFLTPWLMLRYRQRVSAWMAYSDDDHPGPAAPPPRLPLDPLAPLPSPAALFQRSQSVVRARAMAYGIGFGSQAVVLTVLFVIGYAEVITMPLIVLALAVFLIPAALVWLRVSVASGWVQLLIIGIGLVLLGLPGGLLGELTRLIVRNYIGIPLLPLALFHLRFWRGAAPLVFLLALVGFSGWMLAMAIGTRLLGMSGGPALWLLRGTGLVAGLWLGVQLLRRLAAWHGRGQLSDLELSLDIWWLLFTLVQAFIVAIGLSSFLAGLVAISSFALGWWLKRRVLRGMPTPTHSPCRLLLLRVFGNNRRSERLFEQLTQLWNPIGTIELIAGADLALQQVGPQEFLAFLRGHLQDRFNTSPAATAARLARQPRRRPDGSYPTHQAYCHAHTWEPTMELLLAASDAVVMDLREFQRERQGCRIELEALARLPTPRPVVLVTDARSDVPLIRAVLTEAGAHPDEAPWHFVACSSRESRTVRRVLEALA